MFAIPPYFWLNSCVGVEFDYWHTAVAQVASTHYGVSVMHIMGAASSV
jgi:hypothetical protein